MADPTQPWVERTVDLSPQPVPQPHPFQRGVAQVGPRDPVPAPTYEPTGTGWPQPAPEPQRMPPGYHARQLRIGSGWSVFGGLFAFVCWGIWVLSQGGDLVSPALTFVLTLAVAAGLFALTRLVGRVVLERQLGRVRRSAKGAHLVAAVFLIGVGVAYLRQTEWVMDVWNWVRGLF
ncbi:hypothetical protein [Phytohabitans rumicis]|uniref:Uncharacterized protein n=1 Tax=Phytohabitans rumicis TaxID=1076125 RepID=A0A6V8L3Z2_9ACTN|nr:hypothetical protein [Phytohabitans rumicis]GFJ91962.1 hypothetical protein Prum_056040 [Phytohabitans rumicis]